MTFIHGNKVNKLAECNLLHYILNPPKRTKNLNNHYSPILQGFMDIQKGKENFKKFRIILDIGFSSTTIMGKVIKKTQS